MLVIAGTNSGCLFVLTTEPANMRDMSDFITIAALIRCETISENKHIAGIYVLMYMYCIHKVHYLVEQQKIVLLFTKKR